MLEGAGFQVIRTSDEPRPLLRSMKMILSALTERCDAAIVEVYSGRAFRWAEAVSRILRARRKPVMLVLHGGQLADFATQNERRVRELLGSSAIVASPSRFLIDALASHTSGALLYLPNSLDLGRFEFRRRVIVAPSMAWLRAFHEVYDPALAVKVLAAVRETYPAATLTMYGPDKGSLTATRSLAVTLGVSHALLTPGAVANEDVPSLLQKHDVFLNTTRYESFGVSAMEAAACGLCVVTTDAGELPYLWADGKNAMLVGSGDHDEMAAAVVRLIESPSLAGKLSEGAREVAERFDRSNIRAIWINTVEQLMSERK
jgi:glycosyltransferase involved in cell wall biosynthesis